MMTVDFAKLGKTKLGSIDPPPKEPSGIYHGVIRKWEWGVTGFKDQETGQPYPAVKFQVKPTETEAELPANIKLANLLHTCEISANDEDTLNYRIQEFLRSLGITLDGTRNADELLPETLNAQVTYDVVVKDGDRGKFVNTRRIRARENA